jgi:hypothetical protein
MVNNIANPRPKAGDFKKQYSILDRLQESSDENRDVEKDVSFLEVIRSYNDDIKTLVPAYSDNIELRGGRVLFRMFKKVPIHRGIIYTPTFKVPKVKPGDFEDVEDTYHYDTIGVLVNKDPVISDLNIGDVYQISAQLIQPVPVPGTDRLIIPNEFRAFFYSPDNIDDQGYILCYPKDIICKVNM